MNRQYLLDNINTPDTVIARKFGVCVRTVYRRREILNAMKPEGLRRLQWHEDELDYVRQNAEMPNELLAFALDRPIKGVYFKKFYNNIKPFGVDEYE